MFFKLSFVKCVISSVFVFFLIFLLLVVSSFFSISSSSVCVYNCWIGSEVENLVEGLVESLVEGSVEGLVEIEGSMEGLVDGLMEGFAEDIAALEALEGFEGLEDCRIWSLKWTLDFLDRFDLRSVDSAMIIKFKPSIWWYLEFVGAKKMPRR